MEHAEIAVKMAESSIPTTSNSLENVRFISKVFLQTDECQVIE